MVGSCVLVGSIISRFYAFSNFQIAPIEVLKVKREGK